MANNLRIPQIFKLLLFSIILTTLASYKIFANPDTSSFAPNYLPTLDIPYYNGSIKIDGILDDEGWKIANIASNFSEASPGDRIKPKVDTKVLAIYNNEYVYFAFICYDNPKKIRYSYTDRDASFNDDEIGLILDTYGNAEWAYEILLNPLGIQADLRWTPSGEDISFDFIFYSKGIITDSDFRWSWRYHSAAKDFQINLSKYEQHFGEIIKQIREGNIAGQQSVRTILVCPVNSVI